MDFPKTAHEKKNMKVRAFAIFAAALLFVSFFNGDYHEVEDCAIVTAFGVDNQNGELLVTAEIINTQSLSEGATATILYGSGQSMVEAMSDLSSSTPKNLLFSHVSVIVLGDSLSENQVQEVESFCLNNPHLTLSMKTVAAKSAKELLCVKPYTLSITAFEIVSLLNATDKSLSFGKYNSFIRAARGNRLCSKIMALPYFVTGNAGGQTIYKLKGIKIYKNYRHAALLDYSQSEVYEILQNDFESGNLTVFDKSAFIKNCTVTLSAKLENDRLYFNYDIRLSPGKSGITKLDTKGIESSITKLANSIFALQESDVLALGSALQKRYYHLYSRVKNNTAQYIKNADYKVVITFEN